jgi:prepilin-type processing-associated H-X9-DG protein
VVIAVISILAGMLLPALENAVVTARQISCVNKQKQMGYVAATYTNDYDGWVIPLMWAPHPDNQFFRKLFRYEPSLFSKPQFDNGNSPSNPDCPAMENEEGVIYVGSMLIDYSAATTFGGYGMNEHLGYYSSSGLWHEMVKLSQISKPTNTLLFCDAYIGQVSAYYWDKVNPTVAFRHNDGLNVLYIDNHVVWHPAGDSSIVNFIP